MKFFFYFIIISTGVANLNAMEERSLPVNNGETRITVHSVDVNQRNSRVINQINEKIINKVAYSAGTTLSLGGLFCSKLMPNEWEHCSIDKLTLQTHCTPIQAYVALVCVIFIGYNLVKLINSCCCPDKKSKRE